MDVERIEDVLLVMGLDSINLPFGEVLSEAVCVEAPSWSSSASHRHPCRLARESRSFILDKRVDVVAIDGDLRCPTTWRALSVAPVRTLVTLAESGVRLESDLSFARDVVLWLRTLVEPDGSVRIAVLRATLRIELPELARPLSLHPYPDYGISKQE